MTDPITDLVKGNEAIAMGAIAAGCRFYFGYPITPQNDIPEYMSRHLPLAGGTFIQAESEIASINMLLGALCRLVDPLIRARTLKQWEAIAAYRELGHQRDVAERLGVTRQSVGDRLTAGNRRAVEEADAAIAAYLSYQRRQRFGG